MGSIRGSKSEPRSVIKRNLKLEDRSMIWVYKLGLQVYDVKFYDDDHVGNISKVICNVGDKKDAMYV